MEFKYSVIFITTGEICICGDIMNIYLEERYDRGVVIIEGGLEMI